MKRIDAEATRAALPFDRLIEALRTLFATGCDVPPRHVHTVGAGTLLIMPAWNERYLGLKSSTIFPGNVARGLPGLHASYLLHDVTTGLPLAQIDGDEITARRTAAASALAASLLAPPDAKRLFVMGAGRVAALLPEAYRTVRAIERVEVWARRPEAAEALVGRLKAQGFDAQVAPDAEIAARRADIVSCATLSATPIVRGAWLKRGSHLDLIGSFTPSMREADDACFVGAGLWIDVEDALRKSGDLIGPIERGVIAKSAVRGTLETLSREGRVPSSAARSVFKSVGTALEDLAAAMLVYESTA